MAVVARKRKKSITYYIVFSHEGEQVWERVGRDKQQAERLERQRIREVESGTYAKEHSPTTTFGAFMRTWMVERRTRNASEDVSQITRHLLTRSWLMSLECELVRPMHSARLVDELKATVSEKTGKPLATKYVSNLYGLYTSCCRAARIKELMHADPCVLPRGKLRRTSKANTRKPYGLADVAALISPRVSGEGRVFAALALLTGMREGEVCGRRWRDLDSEATPLGSLDVTSQYDDRPLKTDHDETGEHARRAPVHPRLAEVLAWWKAEGFEWQYCRRPTPDDFIVPRTDDGQPHTRSSAYKLWRASCLQAGVVNVSLHSARHTFLTLCRRAGAREEVIEKVTHNAAGTIVDQYTHWDWEPLCAAVACLTLPVAPIIDAVIDATQETSKNTSGGAGNRSGDATRQYAESPVSLAEFRASHAPQKVGVIPQAATNPATRQRPGGGPAKGRGDAAVIPFGAAGRRQPPAWVHEAVANLGRLLASVR